MNLKTITRSPFNVSKKPEIRQTKIIATIGPACDSAEMLTEMIRAGMNVARLNLSFGTLVEQKQRLERVRSAADELDANVAIMVDTRGIEIRSGKLKGGTVNILAGTQFSLYTDGRAGDAAGVSVSYKGLPMEVKQGVAILLDDGAIELESIAVEKDAIKCRVIHGGILRENKSVNLPDVELSIYGSSAESRAEITRESSFAADNNVEYVAASFIQNAEEIHTLRRILREKNVEIPIIAKIENKAGVNNLDEIVDAADGVMVARGDLGVELPLADVPSTQKKIIRTTVTNGKPVITATEMLASMERNPKPTRAEASDVANAILDGTSGVMLSAETAVGKFPVESVETMAKLAMRTEASLSEYGYLQKILPNPSNIVTEAVGQAAVKIAEQLFAVAIISLTSRGFTSRLISKHRPDCPILAVTSSREVARRLSMNWGVIPMLYDQEEQSDEAQIRFAISRAKQLRYIEPGDIVVATAGSGQRAGGTDLIRVITLEE